MKAIRFAESKANPSVYPRVRKFLQFLLGCAAVAALAALTLPWWLGAALKPLARGQGVTFGRYERVGYGNFRLHDVEFRRGAVRVTVDRVEAPSPLFWLAPARRQASATHWHVQITPTGKTSGGHTGLPALHSLLQNVAAGLARWVPAARLGSGEVEWPGQTLQVQAVEWKERTFTVQGLAWRELVGDVASSWPASGPVTVRIKGSERQARLDWSGAEVKGNATLWDQPLRIAARFPADRWMPESLDLAAANWELPAQRLKLGPEYATVHGQGHLAWSSDHFIVSAQASAVPRDSAASAPPFTAEIEAKGDLRGATITALHVAAPFATADLSAPVAIDYASGFKSGAAQLTVQADLAKQPWIAARGQVRGVVGLGATGQQEFSLQCEGVAFSDLTLRRAVARGTLQWPRLELAELNLQPDDQSSVTAHGAIDLVTHEVSAGTLEARLAGSWFDRWLPADMRWTKAEASATFSGPLADLKHAGKANLTGADLPALPAVDLDASWRGHGTTLDDFTVRARTGNASLEAAGAADRQHVNLRTLSLVRQDHTWTLAAPASVAWAPELKVGPLRLDHADGFVAIAVSGGPEGAWHVEAANIDSALLRDWLDLPATDWRINTARTEGRFDSGKLVFTAQLNGQILLPTQSQPADVRLRAHGDAKGVELEELATTIGERVVTQASGRIPVAWNAQASPHLQPDWNAPLAVDLRASPDSPLWMLLADFTGVTVESPVATVEMRGTLETPKAELNVKASRVAVTKGKFKEHFPEVTDLALVAHADREGLLIDRLFARVDEQTVQAHGRLPTGRDEWENLRRDPAAFILRHGEGSIDLAEADLARLAKRAPDFMAPQGRLSAHLDLGPQGALSGELHLRDAALRPIDPLGAVQEISADLALKDRQLEIKSWSAKLGGEPVEMRGTIELPPDEPPRVAITVQGKNLPLVRRAGLIVRSDLDLKATTGRNAVTEVTGVVTLHDSVVLADLSMLRPTGKSTARQQPPFFSVEVEPFRDWTLAVDLRGTRAVKIRVPVFTGEASARFRLSGTLGEPRAVGEFTVDEGRVLFPFATFEVQRGNVRLSEADPYHAQVSVNAQYRYHDYLVRLEASGPLESPRIEFTSIPALESTQLLLMVTSGESPENDVAAASGSQRLARLGTYLGQHMLFGSGTDASRLELSSGAEVSRNGRETYEFTYRLNDRWSLVGNYDEYDEYNAGVKWRAWVQEGDKSEKK